jgi:probable HAF family extracellular repeat protein
VNTSTSRTCQTSHVAAVAAFASFSASALAGGGAGFQGIGDLPGGLVESHAYAVSADGSVVTGHSESASGTEAFRWTAGGGMVGLGDIPGGQFWSRARGVSNDGLVIVGLSEIESGQIEAFRWTEAGGMEGIGDLPGGLFRSFAFAVSGDGAVVVGDSASGSSDTEAFRWTDAEGMVGLGDLPGGAFFSYAYAVNDDGTVIVGRGNGVFGTEAYRWTHAGGMVGLGFLPNSTGSSHAYAVNEDGRVVVGDSHNELGELEAMRWTESGGMEGLGDLPGGLFSSTAWAANGDGSIIVGWGDTASGKAAFIWDEVKGMRNLQQVLENDYGLDLTGWTLYSATGISDDGNIIVGRGFNPSGNDEGWIATLDSGTPATVNSHIIRTGTLVAGNTARLRTSNNRFLIIESAFIEGGNPPYLMLLEVKLTSDVLDPQSLHILVEGKLSQNGGTAKLYLRNWTQGGWTLVSNDPIGKTEMTQNAAGLNPADFINASGVMKLRIKHTKTTSSNGDPFRSLIDHVQALVR